MKTSEFGLLYNLKLYSYKILLKTKIIDYDLYVSLTNKNKAYYLSKYTKGYTLDNCQLNTIGTKSPIWVCWWQGKENMPEIVKICYNNLIKNSCEHPVILITEHNFTDYVELPEFIIDKVKKNIISITHLSDILRVSLLYKHGGIWIDSTILLQKPIDSIIPTELEFYSYKHEVGPNHPIISKGLWTTFFIASCKYNSIMKLMQESLIKYWANHNSTIDYFFMDIMFYNLYNKYEDVKRQINILPIKKFNLLDLQKICSEKFSQDTYDDIIKESDFQKISYKIKYKVNTIDGYKTYFSKVKELI